MTNYFQVPWNIKDLLLSVFTTIILGLISYLSLDFFQFNFMPESLNQSTKLLFAFFLQWMVILGPLVLFTYKKYQLSREDFGIRKTPIWTVIKEVLKSYLLFLAISFLIGVLILYYDLKIPGYQIQENILPEFGNTNLDLVIAGLVIILIAPIFEEIFFRGFLLRTLVNKVGVFLGSIISAAIFAILHFPWQSIIPIFILGLIINSIVIRTKSIIPSIVFHIFNNAIVFTLELLVIKDIISIENLA